MGTLKIDITGDNSNVLRAFNGVQQGVTKMQKVIEDSGLSIEQMFNRIQNAAKASLAGFTVKEFVQKVATVRGEFQQLEVAFKTMLGSAEKASTLMAQLTKTAAITPFGLQDVASGAKQLLAYGTAAEEVNDTLIHLGDIAAGLSIPLGDLVMLYGTTMTQGRMFTQDLRQFMGRGIPLAEELAKQFGVTKDKVGELVTAGKVGAEEFKKAIMAMSSEGGRFGGLMEEQSKTITGQISNIEDAIDTMFNEIGKQSEGIINGTLDIITSLVENWESVGAAILAAAEAYGIYKATLMAMTAYNNSITNISYDAEIASLAKLLPMKEAEADADLQIAVAEGRLSASKAEAIASMRMEAQEQLKAMAVKETAAKAEYKSALEKHLMAQRNMAVAQSQVKIAMESGTAEEVVAAKRGAATAKLELQNAAIAKNTAQKNLNTISTQKNALSNGIDAAASAGNTAATGVLTAAKMGLKRAIDAVNASFLASPLFWIAAVIAGVTFAVYKLVTAETAEAAARRNANEQIDEFNKKLDEQEAKIKEHIATIKSETATEYQKVKAYEQLKQLMPSLTDEYSRAEIAALDMVDAEQKINEAMDDADFEDAKAKVEGYREAVERVKKSMEDDARYNGGKNAIFNLGQLERAEADLAEAEKRLRKIQELRAKAAEEMREEAKPIEIRVQEANENYQTKKEILAFYDEAMVLAHRVESANDKIDYEAARSDFDAFISKVEADIKELEEQIEKEPWNPKLEIEKKEKERMYNELVAMKDSWRGIFASPITVWFQAKYTSAKEAEEKARGDRKGMRFDGPTGKYVPLEEEISRTPKEWLKLKKKAWDDAQKELDDYLKGPGKSSDAKNNKEIERLKEAVSKAKKAYEEAGGSTGKSKAAELAKENAAQRGKLFEQEMSERQRHAKQLEALKDAQSAAAIAKEQNRAKRELLQAEKDHQDRLTAIDRQAEEMRKANYEAQKKAWEATNTDNTKSWADTDIAKDVAANGYKNIQLTKEQIATLKALREKENADYANLVKERFDAERQSMIDYLKEYGTYQQQRLAIAEEYSKKIAEAEASGNKWEAKRLTAERDSRIAQTNAQSLAMSIDWNQTFQGIGNVLQDIAKETLDKVNDYMGTAEFKALDASAKKAYADLKQTLIDAGGQTASNPFSSKTWDEIAKLTDEYKFHVKALADASETHTNAVADYQKAVEKEKAARADLDKAIKNQAAHLGKTDQGEYDDAVSRARENLANATQDVADTFQQMQESGEAVQQQQTNVSNTQQNLHQKTEAAAQGLNNFNTVLGQLTSGTLTGFVNGVSNVINALTKNTEDDMQGLIGVIGKKAGGIIGAILSIIDMLGDKPVEFFDNLFDGISKVIEAIISHIPELIMSIVKGAGNIVASVFTGIGSLFGFGSKDRHEEMLERQEKYNNALNSASKAVEHFTEELEKSYGVMAIQNAKTSEELIKKSMETIIKGIDSVMWDNYGGGNSDYYHANKALNWLGGDLQNAGIFDFLKQYGVNAWEDSQGKYTWNALFNNNDPQKLAKMFKDMQILNSDLWRIITTEMGANAGALEEWINKLIDAYDQIEENDKKLKEQLTTTTAENVYDDFLNSLYDLADGSKDVTENMAEDWQKMVNRMVVNNLVFNEEFKKRLNDWYEELAKLQKARTGYYDENGQWVAPTIDDTEYKAGLERLKAEQDAMFDDAKKKVDEYTEEGIIKSIETVEEEQKKYFENLRDSWKSTLTDLSKSTEDWKNELIDQVFSDLVESTILDAPLDVMTGNTKKHFDNLQAYLDDWTRRYKAVLEDATLSDEQRADRLKELMDEQTAVMDEQAKKSKAIAESLGKDVVETFSNALDNLSDKFVEFLTDANANAEDMGKEIAATLMREMLKEMLAQDKYADQIAAIKQLWQNILKSDSGWWWTDTEGQFGPKGAVWTIDKVVEMIGELEDEIAGDTTLQSVADQIKELEKAVEDGKSSFGDLRDSFMDAILDMENGAANLKKKLNETLVKDLIEKTVFDVPLTVTINEDGKTFKKKFEKGFDEYQEDWTQRYLDIYNSAEYSAEQREQLLQALIDELMKAGEDMAAAAVDLAQRVQDAKLDTTFTDMKDSFVSALMDMDGDIEDFANDMKKTIVQKLVEAFMVSEEIKPLLEKLQETFNYAMGLEGKTPEERAKIISEGYANENGEHQLGLSDITGVLTPLQDTVKAMLEAMGYVAKSTEDEVESVFANLGDTILDSLMNTESGVEDFMSGITETIIRELTESFIATEDFQKKLEDVKQQLEEAVKSGDPAKIDAAKEALRALYREADEGTEEWRKALQKLETEEDSTFKDMTSSWTSSLMDFNATAEDWAEDIGRTMAQKIIEKMVAPTLMQPLLDSLQEVFNTALGAQEEGSVDWSAVVNDSGVQAALTALKNAYPELKETVTAILAALDITPEIDEEEAKEGFSNLRDAFISTLTDINGDAETFAKQIGRTMLEQMLDAYIENTYKDQIASINQEWAEALESGNTEAIERIKQKVQELYSTISTDVEVSNIADAIKELDKQLDTTFSDMADSWTSTLMDMEATAEDWAQSVGKMIAEKIIKSMVIPTMIQPILDTMQKAWNAAAEQEGATYQTMLDAMMPYVGQLVGAYEELRPIADYILNSLGVYKETFEEVAEEVEYHLQDLKSNFVSSLMDMEQSAEDWSESISKIMAEAFIKDFVLGDAFDAQMKDWQAHYESILNSGLSEEDRLKQMKLLRDAIVSAKEGYVEQAMAIQELLGLNVASSNQTATANIADKATYEQEDKLIGINMAQEMTLEQILYTLRGGIGVTGVGLGLASSSNADTARQIESTLNSMGGLTSSDSETIREIRGLIIIGNSYLYDIKTSNEQMLRQFGERLESIDGKIGQIF
ncbi:MAG: tape measure protein [Prevotella sp.]|nr:tape measure protein [Prevotella sp.]